MNQTAFRLGLALLFVISLAAVLGAHDSPEYSGEDKLPDMRIDTNGAEIIDKDAYVPCTVSVDSSEDSFTDASAEIKGRGNSTWGQPKKPYSLRFDQKTDLFGNGYAKTWVLLANYLDKSMIRNYLAFSAAEALELDYTTSAQFVNLYLNGEYLGVYLVAEKIQIGKDRVDIGVPDDFLGNAEDFSFILEMDSHAAESGEEDADFFTLGGRYYVIKDPDCTPGQVETAKR
ncbi:MAG: CotH kinase family protein, partial [Candidatus Methanomethylophilaceae archaeon]|nr:CotH kinase family protein [Candidatus Methanomethylophilaceae archaeon]